ncbi:hypothetical protein MCOR25_000760 [Pyricularia grisea]|uniref:N-acetyltransferase domain-containing protein n=1 Tax=Pyricularia grisea TaxID=148305 RepID=A0A6P8BED9_PYRGI|nr:uncharacterized protein PgNI_02674 [Pyricularia grisea]KAI6382170.1 hypothetical protein MCOR25_000760 [Pyricularia grisea]TLD14114.1 hypothetical protein PgNI_02674 [Pyricularia grisea]
MPLQFGFCEPADVPRCFEIVSRAFGTEHGYFEAVFPDHTTPEGRKAGAERLAGALNKPGARLCKVTDTDTGEILGFAKWDVYERLPTNVGPKDGPKGNYWKDDKAKELSDYFWWEFTRRRWDAVRESGGDIVSLDIMVVDPVHHRRGVGRMLMKYGVDEADRLGVESVVEASRMGRFLYENYDFKILEDVLITVPPGQQGTEQFFHWMRRPAKVKAVA